jgi:hypothetical protein
MQYVPDGLLHRDLMTENLEQPTLFVEQEATVPTEELVLFALGDFQSRGKQLADRELALDRLLGAIRRAAELPGGRLLEDHEIATSLRELGAEVHEVPTFVAKHPFKVIVPTELAEKSAQFYREKLSMFGKSGSP